VGEEKRVKKGCGVEVERFDEWNEVKKDISLKENLVGFKPREIFWLRLGQNVGSEEFGKGNEFQRPVLIVRRLTKDIFLAVPLTSKLREDNDYFYTFEYKSKKGIIKNSAMILQVRTFDKKRLMGKIGTISKDDFEKILEKLRKLFIPPKK
jgi:mRNA interferase MazF